MSETGMNESHAANQQEKSPGPSNAATRLERKRQLLETLQAARRRVLTTAAETPSTAVITTLETIVQMQTEQTEDLGRMHDILKEIAADRSPTTSGPWNVRSPEETSRLSERLEVLSRIEETMSMYDRFAETLVEATKRSNRQSEEIVLAVRRSEYLLGQMNETCQKGHELLLRAETQLLNAEGMLSAGRRELQSEVTAISRYIARKLRFAPVLLLLTSLMFALAALTWWSATPTRDMRSPIVGSR